MMDTFIRDMSVAMDEYADAVVASVEEATGVELTPEQLRFVKAWLTTSGKAGAKPANGSLAEVRVGLGLDKDRVVDSTALVIVDERHYRNGERIE